MKQLSLLIALAFMTFGVYAQKAKVNSAVMYFKNYQRDADVDALRSAQEAIDVAVVDASTSSMAKAWMYKGQIYQSLYVEPKVTAKTEDLKEAYDSYSKAFDLDTKKRYDREIQAGMNACMIGYYKQGAAAYKAKDFKSAYNGFNNVLNANEMLNKITGEIKIDTNAIYSTAVSAQAAGLNAEAITNMKKLVELDFQEAGVYQSLFYLHADTDLDMAKSYLDKGRAAFPENQALAIDEINYYLKAGKFDELTSKLQEAIDADPTNPKLVFALANVYDNKKEVEKAAGLYQKAIDMDATYFDAIYNLGALWFNQGGEWTKKMNAEEDMKKYETLKNERDDYFNKALPYFEQASGLDAKDKNTLIALKEIYAKQNKMDKYSETKAKLEALN